jgi:hypothetical protein
VTLNSFPEAFRKQKLLFHVDFYVVFATIVAIYSDSMEPDVTVPFLPLMWQYLFGSKCDPGKDYCAVSCSTFQIMSSVVPLYGDNLVIV